MNKRTINTPFSETGRLVIMHKPIRDYKSLPRPYRPKEFIDLGCTLKVMENSGEQIFSYEFGSNVEGYTISPDGVLLCAATLGPDDSIYCFDLEQKRLLWKYKNHSKIKILGLQFTENSINVYTGKTTGTMTKEYVLKKDGILTGRYAKEKESIGKIKKLKSTAISKGWKSGKNNHDFEEGIQSIICTQCNNICHIDLRFCTNCGYKLANKTDDETYTKTFNFKRFENYEFSRHNIKVQCPSDWQILDHKSLSNIPEGWIYFVPKGNSINVMPAIIMNITKLIKNINQFPLKDLIPTFENLVTRESNFRLIKSELIVLENKQAVKIIKNSDSQQFIDIFIPLMDDEVLTVMAAFTKDSFYKYLPIFDQIITSIRFNPANLDLNEKSLIENEFQKSKTNKVDKINYFDNSSNNNGDNELIKLTYAKLPPQIRLEKAEEYLKNDNTNALAWNAKGFALYELQKHDEAIESYDRAMNLDSKCFLAMYHKANLLMSMNKDDDAIKLYDNALEITDQIININPNNYLVWRTKGLILSDLDQYDNAVECFDKSIKLYPKDFKSWSGKGFALTELKKYYEALNCLDEATEINPSDPTSWNNKAFVYGLLDKPEEELECHDKVLELDPTDFHSWNNKAFVLENLQRYEAALECLKQSIKTNPNYAESWLRKGEILWSLHRFYDAKDDFDQAIKIDPNNADAWYNKACTEVYIGLIDQGLENLKKAIELGGEEIKEKVKEEDKFLEHIRNNPKFISMLK